ncbi:RimJ/RimL family protein N-acetyltransferase [Breoghania corrubedonensis]|uniref:RimJ/RimL family protein N-acetyltransferase n=1 Tax=Breoghania corrubedonensis TaxID=665038 RepID=A0A2T5UWD0_9HYPH|nr:GNAT family N-acetyltransferase [Breoghania corrubedonensis]PTW55792.1 RimJ/RimL family protein N-acetyltransferase [Breoghania corrubedonensis]
MPAIPELESERLILRALRGDDFDAYAAMWADPQVTRYIGNVALTREQSWTRFLRQAGAWVHLGFGYFALIEKVTGDFVGEAGLQDLHRDIEPSIEGMPEAGWVLARHGQGRGLAVEAMRAVLGWADRPRGLERTVCIMDDDNAASRRVAEKLGYRAYAASHYDGAEIAMFERPAGRSGA